MAQEVKVAILEEKLQNFEAVVSKLDSAIEKIAEVNNNVSRMLAVHEKESVNKKKSTQYCLIKSTNCVIKWTAIMTALLQDYQNSNGNFGLLSEYWEQL